LLNKSDEIDNKKSKKKSQQISIIQNSENGMKDRNDLFNYKTIANFFRSKYYPLVFQIMLIIFLAGFIIQGLGEKRSDTESAITMGLFSAFWFLIIWSSNVFAGRSWCSICPVGAIAGAANRFNKGYNFPRKLSNWGLPLLSYVLSLWVLAMVTNFWYSSFLSAIWIISVVGVAIGVSLIYKERIFCKYLCPITAPLAVISRSSPLEVRSKTMSTRLPRSSSTKNNTNHKFISLPMVHTSTLTSIDKYNTITTGRNIDEECKSCKTHDCYKGNEETEGCPWEQHPATMSGNAACSMCMKCTHSCPSGEPMRLFVRKPFSELLNIFRPDYYEVFIIFTLLGLYSFYQWSVIADDLLLRGFHDYLVSTTHLIFPFLTVDAVEEYVVGYFAAIGLGLGLYSFSSLISSKISGIRFKINFANFGYTYLTVFIFHFLLTYSIGYLDNIGQHANIALSNIGINLYLPPNFIVDFTIPAFQIGNDVISYDNLINGIPICLAIPVGGYISYKIAKKITRSNSIYKALIVSSPHIILITAMTILIMYQELILRI